MNQADKSKPGEPKRTADTPQFRLAQWGSLPVVAGVGLVVVTLIVFRPVLHCGFTNYDDPDYFSSNPHVQSGLTWDGVKWAFHSSRLANWHPLVWISYMTDVALFGGGAAGPHFSNLLLHAANAVLVFLLFQRLTHEPWKSIWVAGLFALHPLHVESVAWIAERKDVLSTWFGLLALISYARYVGESKTRSAKSKTWYGLALGFFTFGLMSKPMLVSLPFLLLLLDHWPLRRFDFGFRKTDSAVLRRLILEKLPFFLLGLFFSALTFWLQKRSGAVAGLVSLPWTGRAENAVVSYARYLGKTFWPVKLSFFYSHPGFWPVAWIALATVLLVGGSTVAVRSSDRRPYVFVGWFWFLGTLVPVIGLVQVGLQSMADRYTYIPLIGIFILAAWGLGELAERWGFPKWACAAAGGLAVAACALRTADQLTCWRNSETVFRHALAVTQNNYVAHCNLGWFLAEQGRTTEAVAEFNQAREAYPDFFDAFNGLGYTLGIMGRMDEAVANARRALQLNPHSDAAWNNLGFARFNQGFVEEALACYRSALKINPENADALNNLGFALAQRGDFAAALRYYQATLQVNPRHIEARNNLGVVLDEFGKLDEAIAQYRKVLEQDPAHAHAHSNLGIALARQGKLEEAVVHFRQALSRKPDDPRTHNNLANVLSFQGGTNEAIAEYLEALRLNPQYAEAHNNLAGLYKRLGRTQEAREHLNAALQIKPDYPEAQQQLRELSQPATN